MVRGMTTKKEKKPLVRGGVISCRIRCPPSGSMLHCILLFGEKVGFFVKKTCLLSDVSLFVKVFKAEQGVSIRRSGFFFLLQLHLQGQKF